MNAYSLLDAQSASALRFAWLQAALEPVSEPGRRSAARIVPFSPGQERDAQKHAAHIAHLAQRWSEERIQAAREALGSAPDPQNALARAGMGETLDEAEALELLRFLDAAARADALLEAPSETLMDDAAREVARVLEPGRSGKFGFYLADGFDAALPRARERARAAQQAFAAAREATNARIAHALGREAIADDEFIVMRESAPALPRGVRVLREAATFYLCEAELDEGALQALAARDAAASELDAAEDRARTALSAKVRERAKPLNALLERAGDLDVLLARIRFAQQHACSVPEIAENAGVQVEEARFLPLARDLQAQGRSYQPISLNLEGPAVLTGPNMGGKSAALRTCGFIAVLAAFGLPVPAKSARVALFDEIAWLGIGTGDDHGGLLSAFAQEVVRLRDLLARPARHPLLLIDEFARTTTPAEGTALLVALLRSQRSAGRAAFAATHLSGVAAAAGVPHFAVRGLIGVPADSVPGDVDAALAALASAMDYGIIEVAAGTDGTGDALALARLIGLDPQLIAQAQAVLRDEQERLWSR